MSIISASSTYMDRYLFILALIPTGASAFYKGAVPHQEGPTIPAAAEGLLDNPAVLSDPNSTPPGNAASALVQVAFFVVIVLSFIP